MSAHSIVHSSVILDIASIDREDEIDRDSVTSIVELALESGFLYPPIVVIQSDSDSYLVLHGANTLEAAKKLHRKDPERFSEKIEAYIIESINVSENLAEQSEMASC